MTYVLLVKPKLNSLKLKATPYCLARTQDVQTYLISIIATGLSKD